MEETGVPGGNHRPTASITDETFHTYGLCPARGLNLGHSGVKQSELRRDESGALAHRATAAPERGRERGTSDHKESPDGQEGTPSECKDRIRFSINSISPNVSAQ